MFMKDDDADDDDYSEYDSDSRSMMKGQIMTPYRGSMFGGTYIGEDSGNIGAQIDQIQTGPTHSHFIYLSDIERIICFQQSLIIVKNNQEIDKFILKNEERVQQFAT